MKSSIAILIFGLCLIAGGIYTFNFPAVFTGTGFCCLGIFYITKVFKL